LRSIGDVTSRLDRTEPTLNTAVAGDERDTTTPRAIARSVARIVFGDALRDASRAQLVRWLEACSTGRQRLRAGLPSGWRAGDKTGSGENGATCDVAVTWPPGGEPIVIAAYLTECASPANARNRAIADVARGVVDVMRVSPR
jgi:beta-lactamase class A